MNKTTTVSALFLAGAMLVNTTDVQAVEMPSGTTVAAAAVLGMWAMLYTRKPEKNFTPRYSMQKTRRISSALSKDYLENLWFMFYDGFIGQRKQSSAVKVKEDGRVYASEETPAHGVLGTIDSYVAPTVDAAKNYILTYAVYRALAGKDRTFDGVADIVANKGVKKA